MTVSFMESGDIVQKLLTTSPLDESLPRYIEISGMLTDSRPCKLMIDRHRISIIDSLKYRIRVDGAWIALLNKAGNRYGA